MSTVETLKRALARVGSAAELARALAVTPSHISRLTKGTAGISAELSMRLSLLLGRPALRGLREDGHAELAELIASLPGMRDEPAQTVHPLEMRLARLSRPLQSRIYALIDTMALEAERSSTARRQSVRE